MSVILTCLSFSPETKPNNPQPRLKQQYRQQMGLLKTKTKVMISLIGYDFGFNTMDEFDWFNRIYPKLFAYINKNYNINIRSVLSTCMMI